MGRVRHRAEASVTTVSEPRAADSVVSALALRRISQVGGFVYVVLAGAVLLAGRGQHPRAWGIHLLGFLPGAAWVAAAALLAAALVPAVARRLATGGFGIGDWCTRSWVRATLVAILAGAAFAWGRLPYQFLGDGVVWIQKIHNRGGFSHFEPLATALASLVAGRSSQPAIAAAWPSVLFGMVYCVAVTFLCRGLWRDAWSRALGWLLLIVSPASLLFFGYIESYPMLLTMQALFAWGIHAAARGRWRFLPAVVLAVSIATHLQAIAWLPALMALTLQRDAASGSSSTTERRVRRLLQGALWCGVALVGGFLLVWAIGTSPLTLLGNLVGHNGLGGLSNLMNPVRRSIDIANEVTLVLGSALLLAPAALAGRVWPRAGVWVPMAWLLAGPLLFLLVVPPRIGGARDWDLYIAAFLPATLLAVEIWRRALVAPARSESTALAAVLAGRALAFTVVVTAAWLAVNIDAPRAARRFLVLQDKRGTYSNYARGYANETLGIYYRTLDPKAARDAYSRAVEANPNNSRYFNNLANSELILQNVGPARDAFRKTYELGMREWFVLYNLALCELQMGNIGPALDVSEELVRTAPERWQGWASRGQVLVQLGRPAEALADFDRAIAIAPREANLHYLRGLAASNLGRIDEARAAWETALRLNPRDDVARRALTALQKLR